MRGVIALAAAISLPELLDDGTNFPQRNVLIFLTFCVILFTLVAQGLSLPLLIRKLGMVDASGVNGEEWAARRKMLNAALEEIQSLRGKEFPEDEEPLADLLHHYQHRVEEANRTPVEKEPSITNGEHYRRLAARLRDVERSTILRMRDRDEINDEVLRVLERELDLQDAHHLSTNA